MRILVTTEQWFPDYAGGTARVARETAAALAAVGHRVTVVAPEFPGLPAHAMEDGVEVHRVLRRLRGLPKTYTDAFALRHVLGRMSAREFDVVLAHHPTSVVGARGLGIPIAYVFHASPVREARHRRLRGVGATAAIRSLSVEPVLASLERAAAGQAARVLVLSEYSAALFREDHPDAAHRIIVAGGGVDTEVYRPADVRADLRRRRGFGGDDLLLLTVRRLVNRMGIDVLLEAMPEVRRQVPGAQLVIIGQGEGRAGLERLAASLAIAEHVQFAGRVSDADLLEWYQAADLFVLPTVAYEGFGIATVEALASGTPVVGTAVGATPEILGHIDAGLIAGEATSASLTEAIVRAAGNVGGPLRERCRLVARDRYSWSAVIANWEAALGAAISGSGETAGRPGNF